MQTRNYNPLNLLKKLFRQKPVDQESTLIIWRKRIFKTIFSCMILSSLFSYISNVQFAVQSEQWLNAIIYTLGYAGLVAIVLVQAIPFIARAWVGLLILYGIGLFSVISVGPAGAGRMFLFVFS